MSACRPALTNQIAFATLGRSRPQRLAKQFETRIVDAGTYRTWVRVSGSRGAAGEPDPLIRNVKAAGTCRQGDRKPGQPVDT